ncbi:MmgE/PrpD family protein [Variovorax saccharolyticus]|uniref:MmgE/PrpD family protein n=1 Tax=Variovorax saccharolyticus TaxID=3053516 RepID=UPI00257627AD|nr:MmgE/PrpD family protein [Variovorax sp. J22R187]MDM0021820.1 MmgE/PrpD family protein [Variovorax sp. J22R187]
MDLTDHPRHPALTGAQGPAEDFAAVLARFGCGLTLDRLAPPVLAAAKMNLLDTLACAAAGSGAPGVAEARSLATEWAGAAQASVLVFGDKVPAHHAAWVNGTMAHARDYDDTHDAAVLHAGVSVVPAALAAAQLRGATSGADFIAAIAAGLETICRLGVATRIGIVESGYMYTSLFGHFAATVAAGRVLGLDPTQMVNALGIAYSQVAGNHQVTRDGALTKRMQPGFAAQSALVSVQLALRNVRGVQATFEGDDGFLRVYLRDRCDREALRDGLGERFEFTQLSYKPYPCCRLNHSAIDAALALRAGHGIRPDQVKRIRVGINRQAHEAVCTPIDVRKTPRSIVHAQFSLPYTVAAALVDGAVRLGHFEQGSLGREDILALAQRVDPYIDEDIEREWGRNVTPALLHIELNDGSTHRLRIDQPLGHPERPMTSAAMEAKAADCFRAAARPLRTDGAARLRQCVDGLERCDDVSVLAGILEPTA